MHGRWGKRIIPFAGLAKHGLIGDRRTAALVAADGTINWLCLPDYDREVVFGALLDCRKGGHWRLGPKRLIEGKQSYVSDTAILETRWELETGTMVLTDAMLWPETRRATEQQSVRAVVRSLRCESGTVPCTFYLQAGYNFEMLSSVFRATGSGFSVDLPDLGLRLWTSAVVQSDSSRVEGEMVLRKGQEIWAVLDCGPMVQEWSVDSLKRELRHLRHYWVQWCENLSAREELNGAAKRTAITVHLLTYAPEGSVVAAPTASVPERWGGGWNADYRLTWIRDSSLALGLLARLGKTEDTERYLQWVVKRQSPRGRPLQVLYDIHGGPKPKQREIHSASGYRMSRPVRFGNHAYEQHQFGSLGFLADCTWIYLQEGGNWCDDYWKLIRRCANYTMKYWTSPDNGLWELAVPKHFVHSKVLCWVTLDRAIKIARRVNSGFDTTSWHSVSLEIHRDVMENGWSEALGSFTQHYGADNLDAAELLVSIMGFLPADHPRVLSTVDRIAETLTINGLVYRFDPMLTEGVNDLPLGEMEGAFLPCTFWLATAYAKAGRVEQAKSILSKVEQMTGTLGLFPEAIDARLNVFLGNTPLLFSHVEYVRAKLETVLAQSRQLSRNGSVDGSVCARKKGARANRN